MSSLTKVYWRTVVLDGSHFHGRLPCLFCRHARRRKSLDEWRSVCGRCRNLSNEEVEILSWNQESDPDLVVVPPNILRSSRVNSDVRYELAMESLRSWQVGAGARVLDVGCGISTQAEMFRGYRYLGVDINTARLGFGARCHPWATYAAHDLRRLGFAPDLFDAILCLEVIEHLPPTEHAALARELVRVLRTRGLLVLTTPDGRMTTAKKVFGARCEHSHEQELTQSEVTRLLSNAGAQVLDCRPVANLVQPAGIIGAVLAHLFADRPSLRRIMTRFWAWAGYRTLMYTATKA